MRRIAALKIIFLPT